MAAKSRGMGANPLARSAGGQGRSLVSALGDSSGITMVATSSVSSNPDNPSGRVADVESLIESVREVGVLQPLLLAPSGVFGLAHPEHLEAVQGFEWVILAGHRRHVAAIGAGLAEVPAVVREDLSRDGRDDEVLLHENLHRKELTALEEARGYGRMASRGLSQRAIARHTGISQGQIAKRMSLLKLVPEVQDAVDTDKLVVIEALSWAKEPEDVQLAAWRPTPRFQKMPHVKTQVVCFKQPNANWPSKRGWRRPRSRPQSWEFRYISALHREGLVESGQWSTQLRSMRLRNVGICLLSRGVSTMNPR